MARITVITNQKGGVGKTSTAHALSAGLTDAGYRVLVIDCDPQSNLSYAMQAEFNEKSLYEAMKSDIPIEDMIQHTSQGDIVASSLLLAGADMEFTDTGREYILENILEPVKERYSHIIIDTPPTLGILTTNALVACTDIVVPITADIFPLQGLSQLFNTINKVKKYCRKNVIVAGILICRYSSRSIISRELKEEIESITKKMDTNLYNSIIREGVAIRETQIQKSNPFHYAPLSNPVLDYKSFINEYLNQEKRGI